MEIEAKEKEEERQVASAVSSEVIISLRNVNKYFGDFQALKGVNLDVHTGERIVICGPSGSGKSTLIRCINRLEEHQQGDIEVTGVKLDENLNNVDQVRSEVGMVFQSFNLFPHLTVLQNCALSPIWVRKMGKSEAEELAMEYLNRVHIPEQADKFPGQLSGGQQQRLCIARTIAVQPKIILMDEPTSALDPIATAKIEELIISLKEQYSIVIVTHNMQQASRISDYTCLLYTSPSPRDLSTSRMPSSA